jgi:hypothetical protein
MSLRGHCSSNQFWALANSLLSFDHCTMDETPPQALDPVLMGEIVATVGTAEFAPTLDRCLRQIAPFDLSAVLAYPDDARPLFLHNGLNDISSPEAMESYLDGTYLLDAIYTACKRRVASGLYRLTDLAPDEFFQGEYYNSPTVHPCISLESGTLAEEIA